MRVASKAWPGPGADRVQYRGATAAAVAGLAVMLSGCGGGGGTASTASGSTVRSGSAPPAVLAALPGHVSEDRLLRSADGCYGYQVGTRDLGYVAPLIAANGERICL